MSLQKHLQIVQNLNFPRNEFVIVGSFIMEHFHIRDAHDVDVLVIATLWNKLKNEYTIDTSFGFQRIIIDEFIEIFGPGDLFTADSFMTVEQIISTADVYEDIRYMNMDLLIAFKKRLNREKDVRDLTLIAKFLEAVE